MMQTICCCHRSVLNSRFITCQLNTSKGRGHDRLPNWNPKNRGMLISQPISRCLTNHSELCMSRLLNRLQRRPCFGFESSVSSTPMTSGDPVVAASWRSCCWHKFFSITYSNNGHRHLSIGLCKVSERGSIIYRDVSKNFKVMLQQLTESRKTAGCIRSLKQFSLQCLSKTLQILRRCYRWRKTVPGARRGDWKGTVANSV